MHNTKRKILFFDIDGTLLPMRSQTIPQSALDALKKAQENGHYVFINSGRTMVMIPRQIRELGPDGYVCGCGTEIYMHGEQLFSVAIPNPQCLVLVQVLRQCRIGFILECPDRLLYDSSSLQPYRDLAPLKARFHMEDIAEFTREQMEALTFCKCFLNLGPDSDRKAFRSFCEGKYAIFVHRDDAWEVTMENHSKATGMEFLLNHLNIPREDSFSFGDSPNDLPMLEYAGTSVAMGNAAPEILPYCAYQTTHILEDGIANALEHFGLIGR